MQGWSREAMGLGYGGWLLNARVYVIGKSRVPYSWHLEHVRIPTFLSIFPLTDSVRLFVCSALPIALSVFSVLPAFPPFLSSNDTPCPTHVARSPQRFHIHVSCLLFYPTEIKDATPISTSLFKSYLYTLYPISLPTACSMIASHF